jgi:hypothetical protein
MGLRNGRTNEVTSFDLAQAWHAAAPPASRGPGMIAGLSHTERRAR